MTSWLDRPTIHLGGGDWVTPLWHCFGTPATPPVDERTVLAMLETSGSRLLPLNCHALETDGLLVGHGDVTWEGLQVATAGQMVPCLNVNLQTSAEAAVELARVARDETGIDLVKLEVLTDDLTESNDRELLEATAKLINDDFRVMPLVSSDPWMAETLKMMEAPLLRVMGSPIGSGGGIQKPTALRSIVELGLPVVLDGGIATPADAKQALSLGCAGFLLNTCLFADGDPVGALTRFRNELAEHPSHDAIWAQWWESSGRVACG